MFSCGSFSFCASRVAVVNVSLLCHIRHRYATAWLLSGNVMPRACLLCLRSHASAKDYTVSIAITRVPRLSCRFGLSLTHSALCSPSMQCSPNDRQCISIGPKYTRLFLSHACRLTTDFIDRSSDCRILHPAHLHQGFS